MVNTDHICTEKTEKRGDGLINPDWKRKGHLVDVLRFLEFWPPSSAWSSAHRRHQSPQGCKGYPTKPSRFTHHRHYAIHICAFLLTRRTTPKDPLPNERPWNIGTHHATCSLSCAKLCSFAIYPDSMDDLTLCHLRKQKENHGKPLQQTALAGVLPTSRKQIGAIVHGSICPIGRVKHPDRRPRQGSQSQTS